MIYAPNYNQIPSALGWKWKREGREMFSRWCLSLIHQKLVGKSPGSMVLVGRVTGVKRDPVFPLVFFFPHFLSFFHYQLAHPPPPFSNWLQIPLSLSFLFFSFHLNHPCVTSSLLQILLEPSRSMVK